MPRTVDKKKRIKKKRVVKKQGKVKNRGFMQLPIDKLYPAHWNYKTDSEKLKERLIKNIERNGQVENIIVRQLGVNKFEVVNGNHRLDAFIELDMENVMCFNLCKISDEQAKRIAIETNETIFETDPLRLAETVMSIVPEFSVDDLEESFPYTREEIDGMSKLLDWDWNSIERDMKKFAKETRDQAQLTTVANLFEQLGIVGVPMHIEQVVLEVVGALIMEKELTAGREAEALLYLCEAYKKNSKKKK